MVKGCHNAIEKSISWANRKSLQVREMERLEMHPVCPDEGICLQKVISIVGHTFMRRFAVVVCGRNIKSKS